METVRLSAVKQIAFACLEYPNLITDSDFDFAGNDNPGLFPVVGQEFGPCVRA